MKQHYILVLSVLILSSCVTQKKIVTKRFETFKIKRIKNQKPDDNVDIKAFSFTTKQNKVPKNIFDLSERGQKELIKAMSKNSSENEGLTNKIASSIKKVAPPKKVIDKTTFDRTIVFSVENKRKILGVNRIQRVEINISPTTTGQFEFVSWDKIASEYSSIDLGKITSSDTSTFSISPELTLSGTLQGKVAAGFSKSSTLSQEKNLNQRSVNLSGSLSSNKVKVIREGGEFLDLEGNTILNLKIKLETGAEHDFTIFKNLNTAKKIPEVNFTTVKYPIISKDGIQANLNYEYVYREVLSSDTDNFNIDTSTNIEGDDNTTFIINEEQAGKPFIILRKEDFEISNLYFYSENNDAITLYLKDTNLSEKYGYVHVNLRSFEEALELMKWLIKSVKSGSTNFKIGDYELVLAEYTQDSNGDLIPKIHPINLNTLDDLIIGIEDVTSKY